MSVQKYFNIISIQTRYRKINRKERLTNSHSWDVSTVYPKY